jgi:hypothetical protein
MPCKSSPLLDRKPNTEITPVVAKIGSRFFSSSQIRLRLKENVKKGKPIRINPITEKKATLLFCEEYSSGRLLRSGSETSNRKTKLTC